MFSVPYNFTHDEHKFTIRLQIDEDGEETEKLELDIDGLLFSKHQFVSEDFILEDGKQLLYCAGLALNKVDVFEKGAYETWSSSMLNQRILKKFGDDLIKAVKIHNLKQTTQVTNESLDTVIKRDSIEGGYEEFEIRTWNGLETPLEETVLEELKSKLEHVQKFSVTNVTCVPRAVREQLLEFAADVIEQQT